MRKAIGTILLIGALVLGGYAAKVVYDDHQAHRDVQPAPSKSLRVEVVEVSSDRLQRDYAANEVRADERYRSRQLRVTGAVHSIGKNFADEPYVALWTTNEFDDVLAFFPTTNGLSELSPGDHIVVICKGGGKTISPVLRGCAME